jgi:exosome complex exonuclease DIS3/RRP44
VRDYVDMLPAEQSTALSDLVAAPGEAMDTGDAAQRKGDRAALYDEVCRCTAGTLWIRSTRLQYLPNADLLAGVKAGAYHQGHFNPNPYNYLEVRSLAQARQHCGDAKRRALSMCRPLSSPYSSSDGRT